MTRCHEMKHELPEGYAVRNPAMDDFRAVADLILASDLAGFGEPDYLEDELLADWKDLDLKMNAWVVVAPGGDLAGYAAVEHRGHGLVYAEGYVHPRYTGRGVGTSLIRLTEAWARERVPLAPPGTRVVLDNTINGKDGQARRLLEREGYEAVRHFWRMAIELEEAPPEPELPDGVSIRPCVPGEDERAAFDALDEALRNHWEHPPTTFEEWERRKKRFGFEPGLWLLAGAAVCEDRSGTGWVNELAVRRPWRRRGLGLAMLRRAFLEFYRRGTNKVALTVDTQSLTGATRLYERAGVGRMALFRVPERATRGRVARGTPPGAVRRCLGAGSRIGP
jgi:mycothiol synthase